MKKEDIYNQLNTLNLDKDKYVIISGAALVLQDIILETNDIDLSCDKDYYEKINWSEKMGFFIKPIKYWNSFEIGPDFYFPCDTVMINGYHVMSLNACLDLKIKCNRRKDEEIIQNLKRKLNIM